MPDDAEEIDKDDDICPTCNGTGYTTAWINNMPEVTLLLIIVIFVIIVGKEILEWLGVV